MPTLTWRMFWELRTCRQRAAAATAATAAAAAAATAAAVLCCSFLWLLTPAPAGAGGASDPDMLQQLFTAAGGLCKVLAKPLAADITTTLKHTAGQPAARGGRMSHSVPASYDSPLLLLLLLLLLPWSGLMHCSFSMTHHSCHFCHSVT
jgi:hypothetical protein